MPVGSALPSGAECASRVKAAAEIRPENAAANANRGSRATANTRGDWSGFARVDGDFAGTTDEIIQWAACKWGIDENIARAQVIKESYWYQSANGDNGQSWGLGQVRNSPAHASAFHWMCAPECKPENVGRGHWLVSRVYTLVGRAEPALHHATRCLEICEADELRDWDLAFAYEALARAHKTAGDDAEVERYRALAESVEIADAEDREVLERDLATLT